jgi:hypothetical protein
LKLSSFLLIPEGEGDEKSQQSVFEALRREAITPIRVNSESQGVKPTTLNKKSSWVQPKINTNSFSGFFTTLYRFFTSHSMMRPATEGINAAKLPS